ncbi:hypothetical protein CU097_014202 [Rhizopus azygosporus]|uniref:Uncharacterized protein n=1 Tax=Rhizopus azygosporus TaxID=86630 RepID=A0A367JYR2_RHIAZ|nr:hypothetical protein CU097_014202 [Rhizopus azygosporus]
MYFEQHRADQRVDGVQNGPYHHGNEVIEFGSVEVKKQDVSDETANVQLNKDIRVNKSILRRLSNHLHQDNKSSFTVMGLVAVKLSDESLFIPADADGLEEYIFSTSLDQLLNYQANYKHRMNDI